MNKKLKKGWSFLCKDKTKSPVIGTPVYVKDEALIEYNFPAEFKGGTIVEDWSLVDPKGNIHYGFLVRHKNGDFFWSDSDLVEVGGLQLNFEE